MLRPAAGQGTEILGWEGNIDPPSTLLWGWEIQDAGLGTIRQVLTPLGPFSLYVSGHGVRVNFACLGALVRHTIAHWVVPPYFGGAESISGPGLPQSLGFGPSLGAKTGGPDPSLGQHLIPNRSSTDPNRPQPTTNRILPGSRLLMFDEP